MNEDVLVVVVAVLAIGDDENDEDVVVDVLLEDEVMDGDVDFVVDWVVVDWDVVILVDVAVVEAVVVNVDAEANDKEDVVVDVLLEDELVNEADCVIC